MFSREASVEGRGPTISGSGIGKRVSRRYVWKVPIALSLDGNRRGTGRLIDISRDGIAFESYADITVGAELAVKIEKVGTQQLRVLHSAGGTRYGALFLHDPIARSRIDSLLRSLNLPVVEEVQSTSPVGRR